MPAAASCVNVTYRIVDMPKAFDDVPWPAHGETDDRPKPVPRMSRIRERPRLR